MSNATYDVIASMGATRLVIAPGSTNALFLESNMAENAYLLKYYSGGTLEIFGGTGAMGTTMTSAQLGAMNQMGYLMGSSEVLSISGAARCYLSATGATTIVHMLRGRGPRVPEFT